MSNGLFGEAVTRLALRAVGKSNVVLDLGNELLVSNEPGVLMLQKDSVEEAIVRNRDVLFVPAGQAGALAECA